MPRDGSGHSHNAEEQGQTLAHGTGSEDTQPQHTKTNVADPPEPEKGAALEGMNASGGGSSGAHIGDQGSGKGS